ncbi:hypothetical protein ABN764_08600 [Paenibacillaceae sp. P-4]|uniref:hypothetical protein n=1 Tax=Paenibacillaceae bacterium P-4 TaxID=3160969 RepID=UPI0032E83DAA
MNTDKVIALIDKLANETKGNELLWSRLCNIKENNDSNLMIDYFINEIEDTEDANVDQVDSYYVAYKGGLVFLFYIKDIFMDVGYYKLALQKDTISKLTSLNKQDKHKSELMRLQYLIEEQLNNTDDYLDSLLDD